MCYEELMFAAEKVFLNLRKSLMIYEDGSLT